MTIATLSALLLAATPSAADRAALDAEVAAIYRPYAAPDNMDSAWEYPHFSASTAALIEGWRKVAPKDEIDDLSGADWFCLCQDWDRLRARVVGRRMQGPDRAILRLRVDIGWNTIRRPRLVFVREQGRWKLDDLFARPDFPRGLKQALRVTIAADTRK